MLRERVGEFCPHRCSLPCHPGMIVCARVIWRERERTRERNRVRKRESERERVREKEERKRARARAREGEIVFTFSCVRIVHKSQTRARAHTLHSL